MENHKQDENLCTGKLQQQNTKELHAFIQQTYI